MERYASFVTLLPIVIGIRIDSALSAFDYAQSDKDRESRWFVSAFDYAQSDKDRESRRFVSAFDYAQSDKDRESRWFVKLSGAEG